MQSNDISRHDYEESEIRIGNPLILPQSLRSRDYFNLARDREVKKINILCNSKKIF